MNLSDLIEFIPESAPAEMVAGGVAGLFAGMIMGAFDKNKSVKEPSKITGSAVTGIFLVDQSGSLQENFIEWTLNIASVRLGYEMGYQTIHKIIYRGRK